LNLYALMIDPDAKLHAEQCRALSERLCQAIQSMGPNPIAVQMIRAAVENALTSPALSARIGRKDAAEKPGKL